MQSVWGNARDDLGQSEAESSVFGFARKAGLLALARQLRLNHKGLLILCYHGISHSDEHQWRPSLYLSAAAFRRRLEIIRRCGIQVLPLAQALDQVQKGNFSQPSLALTFDDGWQDFHSLAWPILRDFGYPATVYQTSFYSAYNRPVFDTAVSYLLWKGRGRDIRLGEVTGISKTIALDSELSIRSATAAVLDRTSRSKLTADDKDQVLVHIAAKVGVDYEQFLLSRTLHLMNAAELSEISEDGADVQLHTHRHDVPSTKQHFLEEITTNRKWIEAATGKTATHFCYPNGTHRPEFEEWLRDANIESATTCEPGIVSRNSGMFRLPRFTDSSNVSESRFEAWLSGVGLIGSACRRVLGNRGIVSQESEIPAEGVSPSASTAKSEA